MAASYNHAELVRFLPPIGKFWKSNLICESAYMLLFYFCSDGFNFTEVRMYKSKIK